MPNRVAFFRKTKGLTQDSLAELIGCSRQTITRWESGIREPRSSDLIKLSLIFQCSIDELVANKVKNPTKIRDRLSA